MKTEDIGFEKFEEDFYADTKTMFIKSDKGKSVMNGEWIIVHPTDCFTMLPVYECSVCKKTCSGYDPDPICLYCGSNNKVNTKKFINRDLFDDTK